jgi:peptidoglycan lytic transglycosylase G
MGGRALKFLASLSMAIALAGAVVIAAWSQLNAYLVNAGPATEETVVVLPRGAGLAEITRALVDARVIDHPWLFRLAVRVLDRDRRLKAGEYAFPAGATPQGVIAMLATGETVARRLTVPEGLTVAEILELVASVEALEGQLPPPPGEGSLLPETYFYALGDSRIGLVRRMQAAMQKALDELWPHRAEGLPFRTREEAVILASIVDKETGIAAERDKVAAVFVNRLRRGMRLQADPTVIYGLTEGDGELGRELSRRDWEHDSAYNTYQIDGLPPGPIGNPGRASIEAVLNPAAVDYLYFVADGSGGHAFARTLDEHNRNVAQWRRIKNGERPQSIVPPPPKPESAS